LANGPRGLEEEEKDGRRKQQQQPKKEGAFPFVPLRTTGFLPPSLPASNSSFPDLQWINPEGFSSSSSLYPSIIHIHSSVARQVGSIIRLYLHPGHPLGWPRFGPESQLGWARRTRNNGGRRNRVNGDGRKEGWKEEGRRRMTSG
jgi:hypothetical protein